MSYELVWFKRDLRWQDHAALAHASKLGPVRCIYVVEPELWLQPDAALQHFEFVRESLQALDAELRLQGGCVEVHTGELPGVLSRIWNEAPFRQLHAHQETGNGFTYARDLRVDAWCKAHQVGWHEYPQFGVVRGLKNRNLWQPAWERHMAEPLQDVGELQFWRTFVNAPTTTSPHAMPHASRHTWCTPSQMKAPSHLQHNPPLRQRGGRPLALETLHSFLHARSLGYRGGISSPLSAPDACSRLSTYLAWGCISMREVVQHTRAHIAQLPPQASRHRAGLTGFISRLYWHCHFIQKLESESAIEWQNMHRGYDGLREHDFNEAHFEALKAARTGWPMVDACVTMLRETGWLNFRMRAMLVSVAAYPLWLHWRPVGEWLATQFLDYEPGIHWCQLQMQSGTTGINTTRVYNPIKQAQDHDPHGRFVRQWLPAMRQVPDTWLFEPWLMPDTMQAHLGVFIGSNSDTPSALVQPVVDLAQATREAKQRLHIRRQTDEVKAAKKAVVDKHASRKNWGTRSATSRRSTASSPAEKQQLGFDF
ncbi:MAG: deoxyribodipyrimidine photolyase [Burkholderiales bacterium 35-55-47]|jgi:deoxyribodipyrimidine photo-lyase|uniref:cryptochrome/deoxyribodipyrimidine photo-lyase family protein n=1 Tax=Limnohabitans sp. TaxID=1907725 RepID=UPI000BCAA8B4|nr:FAD-binding domain-containing protein [Limnohabitans sp.]OYY18781.1 MAG: deoxyribodipyrimidine photolyase [Burkholderiales bacterium 35-55-47]OYZ73599.1 MAG: deoxyribodipyrimidine photolyase [Burkholderiales bacterium 24-55-52]OZB00745.1 MAG: deoxyribodipyrimidine photolyase [Burkholderiales bacterium 39-55-53]HQR85494.1 FAD-binding domain-containing protein [Limnohabitans sp.]HQS26589.1 FAD-binding domain-containing protein [Limnohabitans sp.]